MKHSGFFRRNLKSPVTNQKSEIPGANQTMSKPLIQQKLLQSGAETEINSHPISRADCLKGLSQQ